MFDFEQIKAILDVLDVTAQSKSIEDPQDAQHRRWKEKWSFIIVMVCLIGILGWLILYVTFNPDSKNEGIAISGAISIAIGMAGYYLKGNKN